MQLEKYRGLSLNIQNPRGDFFDQRKVLKVEEPEEHPPIAALRDLQPDEMSPKEALKNMYQLKKLM